MDSETLLRHIGAATLGTLLYKLIPFIYLHLRPSSLPRYKHKKNSWALITGSSDGIGQGFAQSLCSKGFNVILHGRNREKLSKIKSELALEYPGVDIETVVADAFDYDADIKGIVKVAENLEGELTVLVNNVGGSLVTPLFGALAEVDGKYVDDLMNLNARFPTQLTRALLPLLIRNSPALVLNVCSITGLQGMPYLTTYSASKAFNYCFTEALRAEMMAEGKDVEVLGIVVGNVMSGGNKIKQGFTCTSRQMAEESLARVGCGKANVIGWWRHAVQWWAMDLMPRWASEALIRQSMKQRRMEDQKSG